MKPIFATIFLLVPGVLLACSVCFGDPESGQTKGLNMAIISLLLCVGTMLLAFAAFFLYLRRRAKMSNNLPQGKNL